MNFKNILVPVKDSLAIRLERCSSSGWRENTAKKKTQLTG